MKPFSFPVSRAACAIALCIQLVACADTRTSFTTQPTSAAGNYAQPQVLSSPKPLEGTSNASSAMCNGDTTPPILFSGWKLIWQRAFDQPIARPPEIGDAQLILIERADPFPGEFRDTLWLLDPRTGATRWRFYDDTEDAARPVRWIRSLRTSPKYIALHIQHQDEGLFSSNPPLGYLVILDRASGHLIYKTQTDIREMTISNDALYYRGGDGYLRRIDLPTSIERWRQSGSSHTLERLFNIDPWLYSIGDDQSIHQYDSLDGSQIATATLELVPNLADALVQNQSVSVRSSYGYQRVALFDLEHFISKWNIQVSYRDVKRSNAFGGYIPSMALTTDSIYLFDAQDRLLRIGLSTGNIIWSTPSPGYEAMSRPVIADSSLYVLFADGTLQAISKADGSRAGIVMKAPLWYRIQGSSIPERDVVGGVGAAGDVLIITTGCRSVYAIQRSL